MFNESGWARKSSSNRGERKRQRRLGVGREGIGIIVLLSLLCLFAGTAGADVDVWFKQNIDYNVLELERALASQDWEMVEALFSALSFSAMMASEGIATDDSSIQKQAGVHLEHLFRSLKSALADSSQWTTSSEAQNMVYAGVEQIVYMAVPNVLDVAEFAKEEAAEQAMQVMKPLLLLLLDIMPDWSELPALRADLSELAEKEVLASKLAEEVLLEWEAWENSSARL